jgi:ABC-type multidrug transport system fused ATPase/permease subunit
MHLLMPQLYPQDWPEEGVVRFSKFSTRYREGLDLVVKDIDVTVQSGEKVLSPSPLFS